MNAAEIKALGRVWGEQAGLLSVAELELLMRAVTESEASTFFEVGHYYGLSTCAIVQALLERGGDWHLTTLDAHIADPWVERPAAIDAFERNQAAYFQDSRVFACYERSQEIDRVDAELVFYDGDHGEEQIRFTRAVLDSPAVRSFLFDDRDFHHPRICSIELVAAGWVDRSPKVQRLPGDKTNADTQTMAWFERC